MASAQAPLSPTSSKRSRSRESTSPLSTPAASTPAASTPAATPSASPRTHSLAIPSPAPSTPSTADPQAPDGTPYPAFLRPGRRPELDVQWTRLETAQLERLRDGVQAQAGGADQHSGFARCNSAAHVARNRYVNVDPYQANRVRLAVPPGHDDYINASPIVLASTKSATPLRYIATQGPKNDSWSHIWRMIWKENQDPAVVVMLTQTHEAGREKCFPYYPQSPSSPDMRINQEDEFGDGLIHRLHLAALSQDEDARTEVREMDMTTDDGSESRKIWHLLFAAWPDFSVPEGADRAALLRLVDVSRHKNGDNATNPRIVHCSAGIGRSGTFIALDWLLQELDEGSLDEAPDNEDPVITVIAKLRDQRAGMVQSKNQFLFLYDTLREQWRERWIAAHPAEAADLGITSTPPRSDSEPALKRQKSMRGDDGTLQTTSHVSDAASNPDARAALEAELMDADMTYEKGKT
ncbi:protein-tyrosine phosphatase-like protein [Ampelomyces quisqualis]|uniref:Protein-tyrosine phosphatase-like protein n=1 Tax=Ampelomyces quisqualis TaxID=50730 RepID=A0A6A5QZZ1_AMPQU|nr:protein-tyrosine phosphatase-like protein [Ampelomyces quisqualis]